MGRLFSISGILHNAATQSGNGEIFDVSGLSTVGVAISGSFVGTLTFQGRLASGTWTAIQAENVNSGAVGTTATGTGLFRVPVAGLDEFRVTFAKESGTSVTVTVSGTVAASGVTLADVDIVTGETIVLGAGSAAIGKLAANSGVDIGDVDVTSLPGALQGPGNPTVDSYSCAAINAAAAADQALIAAPGSGKQIWVYGVFMMADTAAGTVSFQDEDNAVLSGVMAVSDEGGWVLPISGNFAMPWIKLATNKALEIDCATSTIDGIICYGIISV